MKKGIKNKKGQGHVEMMLSFVIFIGFLLFTFTFLNPFARTAEPNYIMNNVQKAVINNITDEVGRLSIVLNQSGTCYKFNETDYKGKYKEVDGGNKKYIIYFNAMFNNSATKKQAICNKSNYTLGVYSKEKMVIYNKTIDLKNAYTFGYEDLKKSLGITNDFLFAVRDLVGNPIAELSVSKNIPQGIDVSSVEIPIRVINSNGQIRELVLNIRVW